MCCSWCLGYNIEHDWKKQTKFPFLWGAYVIAGMGFVIWSGASNSKYSTSLTYMVCLKVIRGQGRITEWNGSCNWESGGQAGFHREVTFDGGSQRKSVPGRGTSEHKALRFQAGRRVQRAGWMLNWWSWVSSVQVCEKNEWLSKL